MEWQLVIITGASKGFGRSISEQLAQLSLSPTHFRLVGRDAEGLKAARDTIARGRTVETTVIEEIEVDLSDIANLKGAADRMFAAPQSEHTYFKVCFLNNHGSLGPLAPIGCYEGDTLGEMSLAFNVNVASCCFLTSDLMQRCQAGGEYATLGIRKVLIVNVSSLAAIQPFGSWGIYCAGKAAREMFHRCLAEEVNKRGSDAFPIIRILNYAPGPLDTNMQREIREGVAVDKDTQKYYSELKEQGKLVSPDVSASTLIKLLLFEKFDNGAHIDFYDVSPTFWDSAPTTCCGCSNCMCGVDCQCKRAKKPLCPECSIPN